MQLTLYSRSVLEVFYAFVNVLAVISTFFREKKIISFMSKSSNVNQQNFKLNILKCKYKNHNLYIGWLNV